MNASSVLRAVVLAAVLTSAAAAADPLDKLPAEVNAVAWIDVGKIYDSPLAAKEQWKKKAMQGLLANEMIIPPGIETLAVGARMSYDDQFSSQGEYAVAGVGKELSLKKLSSIIGGEVDSLNGKELLSTPLGGQIVGESDSTWLVVSPGGRQVAARWVREMGSLKGLGSTLRAAVDQKRAGEPIVIAFDVSDQFSPRDLAQRLSESPLKGGSADRVAKLLSTVQFVAFYVEVKDDVRGRVVIQFTESATPLGPVLPELRDRVLARLGASLPDVESWEFEVQGNNVVGSGGLSPQGARRLLSVLNPPGALSAAAQASAGSSEDSVSQQIAVTRRFYRDLRTTVSDVQETVKKQKSNDALWLDKAARKIDDLPQLHVDESLLELAVQISGSLRYQAQAERTSKIRGGTRKAETGANNVYGYVAYGPFGGAVAGRGNPVSAEAISAQSNEASMNVRVDEMRAIDDALSKMRQELTKKYQAEF